MDTDQSENTGRGAGGFGGILKGITELAENGERISKRGAFLHDDPKKGLGGAYSFSVKVGLGGKKEEVGTFGDAREEEAPCSEAPEPAVDVFEEAEGVDIWCRKSDVLEDRDGGHGA